VLHGAETEQLAAGAENSKCIQHIKSLGASYCSSTTNKLVNEFKNDFFPNRTLQAAGELHASTWCVGLSPTV